jgi:hypothetical protein
LPTITEPAGCKINLKSHIKNPNSTKTNSDLDTIHYKWSIDSNIMLLTYHTEAFKTTMDHLQNVTATSINNIMVAVEKARVISDNNNKTVHTI